MAYSAYQLRTWELVSSAKAAPCADCSIQYASHVMQFDHVRGVKLFNVSKSWRSKSFDSVKAEIAKCEIVCANCHADRTFRRCEKKFQKNDFPAEKIPGKEKAPKKAPSESPS